MKFSVIIFLFFALYGCSTRQGGTDLSNLRDSASYSLGMNIAQNLKVQSADINQEALVAGLSDALLDSSDVLISYEAAQMIYMSYRKQEYTAIMEKNKSAGDEFLEANKKKEGVVVLPSGLQYKIIKKGTGRKPTANSTVTVHYRGTLVDGEEFDNSRRSGEPATFTLDRIIPGWKEGLQLMPVGSVFQFFIPPQLAYGEQGARQSIPPNATLIFEVELLKVK